jgi:vacuolar-type H+-ATPase subunit B/Vma2
LPGAVKEIWHDTKGTAKVKLLAMPSKRKLPSKKIQTQPREIDNLATILSSGQAPIYSLLTLEDPSY